MFKNLFKQDQPQPLTPMAELLLSNANQIKQRALLKKQQEESAEIAKEKGRQDTIALLSRHLDIPQLQAKIKPYNNGYDINIYEDLLKFDLVLPECPYIFGGNQPNYLFLYLKTNKKNDLVQIEYSNVHYFLEMDYDVRPKWDSKKEVQLVKLEQEVNQIVDEYIELIDAIKLQCN